MTHQSSSWPTVARWSSRAPVALGRHTFSRRAAERVATVASSTTAAACTTPRSGCPVPSAARTRVSATPGSARSPRTTSTRVPNSRVNASSSVRVAAPGALREVSTTAPAPRSASHRATRSPSPPSPPVTR